MARAAGIEVLEKKIEKAQEDVVKAKQKYDTALARLSDLMDKKDAVKKEQLITAITKSEKSFDEVLRFLNESSNENE